MTRTKTRLTSAIGLVMIPVAIACLGAVAPAFARPAREVAPITADMHSTSTETVADALAKTTTRGTTTAPMTVTVKLRGGVAATLRDDRLRIAGGPTSSSTDATAVLADFPTYRLFDGLTTDGLSSVADLKLATGLADLDDWYTVRVPAATDPEAFVLHLSADPSVETAYVSPVGIAPTMDFSARQSYKSGAPVGIGQAAAAKLAGGLGENVRIFDIEGAWNLKHEDLTRAANAYLVNGTPYDTMANTNDPYHNINHGTAVLGELIGSANGFGVTGIVPNASVSVVNASRTEGNGIPAAIMLATAHAKPGDVILIEQQYDVGTATTEKLVPVEYRDADYAAIKVAVAKGIIVVEAAANGGLNLDNYLDRADSGAIMVGAGQVSGCAGYGPDVARSRASFSNYGARVDVQGPGECVVTTGYGDLAKGTGMNGWYTATFNGTSSASPVVTGAAAALSSIIEQRTGRAATPAEIRKLLKSTGTAQDATVGGHIGPMPNLAKAIAALPAAGGQDQQVQGGDTTAPVVSGPNAIPAFGYTTTAAGRVPTTISWNATDASGIGQFAVKVSTDGADWADVSLASATATKTTLDLTPGHSYRFIVAARDGAGNWSEWRVGSTFHPSLDADTDPNLDYAGSWVRAAWNLATDGALMVTDTPGDKVTVWFTGRSIAWIASCGTSRGQAHIWLDGKDMGLVDLHSDSTQARTIAFAANVSTGVQHKLVIVAVGSIDLDGLAFLD